MFPHKVASINSQIKNIVKYSNAKKTKKFRFSSIYFSSQAIWLELLPLQNNQALIASVIVAQVIPSCLDIK